MAAIELIRFPDIESLSDRPHQYPEYARTFTKGREYRDILYVLDRDMVYKPLAVRAALIHCYLLTYSCSASVAWFYSALDKRARSPDVHNPDSLLVCAVAFIAL
jgi:hypothetical protein